MRNYCTTAELAEIRGCSIQYIQKQLKDGNIFGVFSDKKEYIIPISSLTKHEQWIFTNKQRKSDGLSPLPKPQPHKSLDEFTSDERRELALWKVIIDKWQLGRVNSKIKKSDYDNTFCEIIKPDYPDLTISPEILYRKQKALKDGRLDGLIDKRGKTNKGKRDIPTLLNEAFCYFYLDERCLPISRCYVLLKDWTLQYHSELLSEIPSERTFRRLADDLPEAVVVLCRQGEKAMTGDLLPHLKRWGLPLAQT